MNDTNASSPKSKPPTIGDPRPGLAFTVGVVGHRSLEETDLAALKTSATAIFVEIAAAVRDFHAKDRASTAPSYLGSATGAALSQRPRRRR